MWKIRNQLLCAKFYRRKSGSLSSNYRWLLFRLFEIFNKVSQNLIVHYLHIKTRIKTGHLQFFHPTNEVCRCGRMCELGKISFAELFWMSYMSLNEVQGVLMITLCNGEKTNKYCSCIWHNIINQNVLCRQHEFRAYLKEHFRWVSCVY